MSDKKVLAVVPARYESSRFPGKLLSILKGETIIYRTLSQVLKCTSVDDVVLVTDDERIAKSAAKLPIDIVLKSDVYRNGTERVASVIADYPQYEVIVNIQGDEPFLDPVGLEDLITLLLENKDVEIASLMSQDTCTNTSKNVVKVSVDKENNAVNFTRDLMPNSTFYEHIGVYGFQRDILRKVSQLPQTDREVICKLEQLRWLDNAYKIKMIAVDSSALSIDVPSDIQKAERIIESTLRNSNFPNDRYRKV